MTDNEINIAIAEVCGWKHQTNAESRIEAWRKDFSDGSYTEGLLSYTTDLNAMHEAEKVLTEEQGRQFVRELYSIFDRANEAFEYAAGEPVVTTWYLLGATASQRAEAFLRTLGKWKPNHA